MNLAALKRKYPLHPQVLAIYETVRAQSGKDVDFQERAEMDVAARTKVARQRMATHIIIYDRRHIDRLNHILAHEFGHILRALALPPAERLAPASEDQHIRIAAETLAPEMSIVPVTMRPRILTMWVSGLISQVTNQPIDIRIEQWLAAGYPDLKDEQRAGLQVDIGIIRKVLTPEVEQITAPTIFRLNTAMNYAYLRAIDPILDEDHLAWYKERSAIAALGEQLYHWLADDTLRDFALVNRWAETLGIADWFYWRDFEDMPESYYQD